MKRPFLILSGALMFGEVVMYFSGLAAMLCLAAFTAVAAWAVGRKKIRVFVVLPVLFLLGMVRMGSAVSESPLAQEAEKGEVKLQAAARISEIRMGSDSLVFYADQVVSLENKRLLKGAVVVFGNSALADSGEEALSIGDWVCGDAVFSLYEKGTNFGQFDSRGYYRSLGLEGKLRFSEWERTSSHSSFVHIVKNKIFQVKSNLSQRLYEAAGADGGLLAAVLLGEKSFLSEEDKTLFQNGGMSHIYAISGLHITFVGRGLLRQMKKMGVPKRTRTLAAFLIAALFWLLTGGSVSAKRACLMFCLSVLAGQIGRSYDFCIGVAAACDWILLDQPLAITQPGFQQSFLAMVGILLASSLEKKRDLEEKGNVPRGAGRWKKWIQSLGSTVRATFWIQLILLPATLWHYFQYPLYSLALNLVLVPQLGVVLAGGYLALALIYLWPAAAGLAIGALKALFACWRAVISGALELPGAVLVLGRPETVRVGIYVSAVAGVYLACVMYIRAGSENASDAAAPSLKILTLFRRIPCGYFPIFQALLLPLAFILLARTPEPGLTVTFLDVGQGDGICVQEEGGCCIMIDGGSSDVRAVGDRRLLPFLKARGCDRVDDWFLSHPDADHLSGLRELLESGFPVSRLWISEVFRENEVVHELVSLGNREGCEVRFTGPGQLLGGNGLSLKCLYPEKGQAPASTNNGSMVLLLEYQDISLLFPGDLEQEGEEKLLAAAENLDCQILKAGHHGSKGATGEAFLREVSPILTVISCGKNNSYGHPHEETLERLEAAGSTVLKTMDCGAVTLRITEGRVGYTLFLRP